MPAEKRKINIAIVGGGIGGLCAAIGLSKHAHLNIQIYEAAQKFSEIGAGVSFGPNAQRAMRLLDPRIHEAFYRGATRVNWPGREKQYFEFRIGNAGDRAEEVVVTVDNDVGHSSIHRAVLLDELLKLVPPGIARLGKRLDGIVDEGEEGGGVRLHFDDGEEVVVDGVISADGVHSPTRKYLLGADHPDLKPRFTGHTFYRGLIPMDEVTAVVKEEFALAPTIWPIAPRGIVMHYPIDQGKTLNVACMYDMPTWDNPNWILPVKEQQVLDSFENLAYTTEQIIKLTAKSQNVSQWAVHDHPSAPYFNKGNVCMMGDAAHASTPFLGAGAGQAIEDALVLSRLMGHVVDRAQIPDALRAYDAVRRERSLRVTGESRKAGVNMVFGQDEAGRGKEKKLVEQFGSDMGWLWDLDLEAHAGEAVSIFDKLQGR